MLWSDERIEKAVRQMPLDPSSSTMERMLEWVRDEYEASLNELREDQLAIAKLLSDVGIEHSGFKNQAQRVPILIDRLRNSQHDVIALAVERNGARRVIAQLEAKIAAMQAELDAKDAYIDDLEQAP